MEGGGMPTGLPKDSLSEQIQRALQDLLRTNSHLASTFLQTAAIDSDLDPGHSEIALEKARVALDTVRRFVMRIEDPVVRAEIHSRADELEIMRSNCRVVVARAAKHGTE
jgi:hypothetical protein